MRHRHGGREGARRRLCGASVRPAKYYREQTAERASFAGSQLLTLLPSCTYGLRISVCLKDDMIFGSAYRIGKRFSGFCLSDFVKVAGIISIL